MIGYTFTTNLFSNYLRHSMNSEQSGTNFSLILLIIKYLLINRSSLVKHPLAICMINARMTLNTRTFAHLSLILWMAAVTMRAPKCSVTTMKLHTMLTWQVSYFKQLSRWRQMEIVKVSIPGSGSIRWCLMHLALKDYTWWRVATKSKRLMRLCT